MASYRNSLLHLLSESGRRAPGFSRTAPVAHAVAVCAQAGKVGELGLPGASGVEGSDVVHLDVTVAQIPVGVGKVERADLAPQWPSVEACLLDLQRSELRVSLASQCATHEESPFDGGRADFVDLVGLLREAVQITGGDTFLDGLGGLEHLSLTLEESLDHEQRGLAAAGGLARVERVVRHEVSGLPAHAVRRPEAGQCTCLWFVDWKGAKQLRELLHLHIPGPQLAPAVLHDECTGQHELVLSPCRDPHGQYRMSVRRNGGCVQRTVRRVANLVTSRCQWGLSPSVMVDRKTRPPLHDRKEGA